MMWMTNTLFDAHDVEDDDDDDDDVDVVVS